jgi:hypothetical protein
MNVVAEGSIDSAQNGSFFKIQVEIFGLWRHIMWWNAILSFLWVLSILTFP